MTKMTHSSTVKIIVTPTVSKIQGVLDPQIVQELDYECSFYCAGAEFTQQVQQLMWDGMRHLFSTKTLSFGTGLLERVISVLKKHNISVSVEKRYPEPHKVLQNKTNLSITLHDFQEECLRQIASSDRGLVKLPTGAGKGCLISATVNLRQVPTIVLVHRQDLMYQTKRRMEKEIGISPGLIGDGNVEFKDVSVATVQTLCYNLGIFDTPFEKDTTVISNIKSELRKYQMLISDEVHCLGAPSYYKLAKHFKNAFYRYGFSATPLYRDEALLIEAAIGPLIYEKKPYELFGRYISQLKVVFVPFKHKRASKYLNYASVYKQFVVCNTERNKMIADLASKFKDKKVIIAVRMIDHGRNLQQFLPDCEFISSKISARKRAQVLQRFEEGDLNCVIITNVWEQGIDLPRAEVLIDTRAEKSRVAYVQLIGRVLRKCDNKKGALVIDIADEGVRWLADHTKDRMEIACNEYGYQNVFRVKNRANL